MPDPLHFLRKDWDLDLRAELYKEEFYRTPEWSKGLVDRWDSSTRDELAALRRRKIEERARHLGEIIREQQGPVMIGYWYDALRFEPKARPLTNELLYGSIYLAGSVATYIKSLFNRVRPWVLAPDLSPPLPSLPGHPSYPSGHSTQMHLMALVLAHLAPASRERLMAIAENVAVNRERAGLNYPTDTEAGRTLARKIFDRVTSHDTRFKSVLGDAATEWKGSQP